MAVDFNKFGKSTSETTQTPQNTGATSTAVATPTVTGKINFNKFGKASSAYTAPTQPESDGIVKSIVRPITTMVARPVQLGAALMGADEDTLDKFSKEKLGGYVAPVVRGQGEYGLPSVNDMTKEFGRAAQTVSFGLGAPGTLLASGAMMGTGMALENQGTDSFTTPEGAGELATNVALGMAGGKVLDKFGAPVINFAGRTAGKIAGPAISSAVSNTASKVAGKVGGYMEKTELPLVSKLSKPISEAVTKGAEKFDAGTNRLFTGAKDVTGKAITAWQPGLSKENRTKHWVEKESKDMLIPATESGPTGKRFADAQEIYTKAKDSNIDIADTAIKRKVFTDDIMEGGHYNSADAAKVEREAAAKESSARMRVALEEADRETQKISVADVRDRMIADVNAIPDNRISTEARADRLAKIEKLYGENSAAAQKYKNGYSLTDLHNNKITKSGEAKYNPLGSSSDAISARDAEQQAAIFRKLLEERAPKSLNIKKFNNEIQARFTLANYLDAIHGKKVTEGVAKKFLRQTGRVGGFIAGSTVGGGYLAGLGGSHLSSGAIDLFEGMSNPFKTKALREMKVNEPEVFKEFEKYIKASRSAREARLLLGDGNSTLSPKAKTDNATKNKVSAILQKQQNEKGAIPLNQYYKPLTTGEKVANDFKQNMRVAGNTKALPAPRKDVTILPNRQGTPANVNTPYKAGGNTNVEGISQRSGTAHDKAVQKWLMSNGGGYKQVKGKIKWVGKHPTNTFGQFMIDKTPEGNPKSIFSGETKKKVETPVISEKPSKINEKPASKIDSKATEKPKSTKALPEDLQEALARAEYTIERLKNADVFHKVKTLKKYEGKRGEFKGEINLNSSKGKFDEIYLSEQYAKGGKQGYADDLVQDYYKDKQEIKDAEEELKFVKEKIKAFKAGKDYKKLKDYYVF